MIYIYIEISITIQLYQLKSTPFRAKQRNIFGKNVKSKQGDIVLAIHLGCPPELRPFGCGNGTKVHLIFLEGHRRLPFLSQRCWKNMCCD